MSDIAHLGPVELLTPAGEQSLRFFVDVMGMEIEHQAAMPPSVVTTISIPIGGGP